MSNKSVSDISRFYRLFCTGCGLCHDVLGTNMVVDQNGFLMADGEGETFNEFCRNVCPASGIHCHAMSVTEELGGFEAVYLGWSSDTCIRHWASSGGVLTSLCIYLIESGSVDGIIQIRQSMDGSPITTEVICSRNFDEILSCAGSRYSSSSPLENIGFVLAGGKYAFVGKPCDVVALHNYMRINPEIKEHITFTLSFFCAGTPSMKANEQLLHKMGTTINDCVSLRYRGHGWPGLTKAIDKNGREFYTDYVKSWGETLGRDVRKICRFCADGVGELADISCGDAWYLNNGKIDFADRKGRNIVFARSLLGERILKSAESLGYLHLQSFSKYHDEMKFSQSFQFNRKYYLQPTFMALKLFGKTYPHYPSFFLESFGGRIGKLAFAKRYLGTIKRILQKKYDE